MDFAALLDVFLHLDKHLVTLVAEYGVWVYALLFAIIFVETGLVVMPFLPGDSLLFVAGTIAGVGGMSLPLLLVLLTVAAILGDAVNYSVGRYIGPRVFSAHDRASKWHKLLNHDHLDRAHAFFEKYGGKAVVLARFVPIVRTFVPFVAGAASMTYPAFALYNVIGCVAWVGLCVGAGYAFGNVPVIKNNFSLVALAIVAVSVMPIFIELWRGRRRARSDSPVVQP